MRRKIIPIVVIFIFIFCCLFIVFNSIATAQETGVCGGQISANTIDPSGNVLNFL